jgi:hypothetical protein
MRIPDPPIDPARIVQFMREGYWVETTSNDALEQRARGTPDKLAIADGRVRLGYGEYYRRAERLAAHFVALGLGADDVIAIQLPNWSEFAGPARSRRGRSATSCWTGCGLNELGEPFAGYRRPLALEHAARLSAAD